MISVADLPLDFLMTEITYKNMTELLDRSLLSVNENRNMKFIHPDDFMNKVQL